MSHERVVGWDLGGAHLKAAIIEADGTIAALRQLPCPLWLGMERLEASVTAVRDEYACGAGLHAVTMTGELVDSFANRAEGVTRLVAAMRRLLPAAELQIFGGRLGFLSPERAAESAGDVASANWMASAARAAAAVGEGVFVDIGSTTTDILVLEGGRAAPRGFTDRQRLGCDELVYTGVVRTPVMSLAERVPFQGGWLGLMAEHFATTADVHRLTGRLPAHADLLPAADGGGKTQADSARRLARMLGADREDATMDAWRAVAAYLAECQLQRIHRACERQLSRGGLSPEAPLIGAGVGRFLVRDLALRTGRAYRDFGDLFGASASRYAVEAADCAPALSVAALAQEGLTCTHP